MSSSAIKATGTAGLCDVAYLIEQYSVTFTVPRLADTRLLSQFRSSAAVVL
jgi:hypothetical protein